MNAKDMRPGMLVAVKVADPYYNPIKAEIIAVGGHVADHDSTATKAIAHRVKFLIGSNKNNCYNLVGKRILREWEQEDEDRYLALKAEFMKREIKQAQEEAEKINRAQLVESVMSKLEVLGIGAARGSAYLKMETGEHQYLPVLIVHDPDKLNEIIDRHITTSFALTIPTEDLND